MRRLFGCPDIVSLTENFLMARNFDRIFTENNPVMGDSKTFGIPEAKGLKALWRVYLSNFISWCCYIDLYELKTIFFCVKWIINCLSNNQKF